ncbi:hypothetical protein [Pectobacterium sp. CFBP8739]|uniref:hypothetical protein n=1 Tax=Pectobacterium sp. CFBP8739 TaxID=2748908 RepID=UPI0015E02B0F|nr:hypothetical protein [Pectobacterium sp. CFBP8739]MBA0168888.1 hypothetical protein [Pectobacterium sp. CFBP8739]
MFEIKLFLSCCATKIQNNEKMTLSFCMQTVANIGNRLRTKDDGIIFCLMAVFSFLTV